MSPLPAGEGNSPATRDFEIHPLTPADRDWVSRFIVERWGADFVVAHGVIYHPHQLPGFAAAQAGEKVGLITYHLQGERCEIVTIDSLRPSSGVGSALIDAVKAAARQGRCRRLWLITTNDNLHALGFYQRRGFRLVAIHPNALEQTRKLKPGLSLIGLNGIPLRDEIELEMALD